MLTLGDGTGLDTLALDTNGAPKADLSGCNVGSKESMNCSGHNLGADWADAMGTVNGCGVNRVSNVSAIDDPYQALNSQIPADTTCGGSYPGVTWNSNKALTSTPTRICGNLNITGNVTLTGSGQIVIYNGNLVLSNGVTFKTDTGASASIIFAGTNNSRYGHTFTGGNKNTVLEIEAPSTGTWAGVAIYQKYELTTNVNTEFSGGGNSPTFKITGVVYLPRAHLQLSGSVSKATDGAACLILVSATMRLNGGGELLDRSGCAAAGITMPTGTVSGRTKLVD